MISGSAWNPIDQQIHSIPILTTYVSECVQRAELRASNPQGSRLNLIYYAPVSGTGHENTFGPDARENRNSRRIALRNCADCVHHSGGHHLESPRPLGSLQYIPYPRTSICQIQHIQCSDSVRRRYFVFRFTHTSLGGLPEWYRDQSRV